MPKKYTWKFWLAFWSLSTVFLAAWYLFWNVRFRGVSFAVDGLVNILPISKVNENDYKALAAISDSFLKKDGQEKTLLVLFQNDMELRPGGGFLGAFGIAKIKNGRVVSLETHDLSNFDAGVPNTLKPPYPMKETGYVDFWKMRDSNWSPDFSVDAKKAEEFYRLGGGQENFDGVIGITSNVLTSVLKVTGPISIEGYPGTYDSGNAVLALEYQVEKAFDQQGIDRGERKSIMSDLAKEIEKRVFAFSFRQKVQLAKILLEDLDHKDIQLYFEDAGLQKTIETAQWAGAVDQTNGGDYLMAVDANIGAFKSDYYVKRFMDYTVDLSGSVPVANLKITYEHTAKQKDWMTRNYLSYLRVYVPEGSWLTTQKKFDGVVYEHEFGKKYFGSLVKVPINSAKTIDLTYTLPVQVKENYNLKIQKQAGLSGVPVTVHIIGKDGQKKDYSYVMDSDIVVQN